MIKSFAINTNRRYLTVASGLWAIYALMSWFAPQPPSSYHVSRLELGLVKLTVMLPILVIWLVAVYGAAHFKQYARLIRQSADGRGLDLISSGLLLVVASFISQGLLGLLPNYFVGRKWLDLSVALGNTIPLAMSLIGFGLILSGAMKLRTITLRRLSAAGLAAILLPYCLLSVIYAWNFYQSVPLAAASGIPKFAGPGKMPFFTLAIPYIGMWLMGILAVTIIAEYARTVNGAVYRLALKDLVLGLSGVLGFSILLQLLQLSAGLFAHMSIGGVLAVVYFILILYAAGFVFIAKGARKLMLIEQHL